MGGCGGGESSATASGVDITSGNVVISPMNSNFSAALTCRDVLLIIFEKLPIPDLARASCVCRAWNSVVSDGEIQITAFKAPWKVKEIVGNPSSGSFWRDNSIGKFAISHRIVRGDSVASLAVKYSVQVMNIKRLNNMMSDHGIYSRERLLIPLSNPDLLINGTCYIELDTHAKREVAVLYLEGGPDRKVSHVNNRVTSNQGKKRVIESLKRSMNVDDGTAEYYLSISNGEPQDQKKVLSTCVVLSSNFYGSEPNMSPLIIVCDGAWENNSLWTGIGWFAYLHGKAIFKASVSVKASTSLQAEALACYYAIDWAVTNNHQAAIIKTDCSNLILQLSNKQAAFKEVANIIDNICYISKKISFCKIVKVSRSDVHEAHMLASLARNSFCNRYSSNF